MKVAFTCSLCGGSDVLLDAWARWDIEAQDWLVADTLTQAYCRGCDGETSLVKREIAEAV
ncbi:MAG: hypothetical protein KF780_03530 [Sphingomonas sp.]|nr:hypothetical protein [Sphingomonas sp.]